MMNSVSNSGFVSCGQTLKYATGFYHNQTETDNLIKAFIAFEKRCQRATSELNILVFNCTFGNLPTVRRCVALGFDLKRIYEKRTLLQTLCDAFYTHDKVQRREVRPQYEKTLLFCLRHGADVFHNVSTSNTSLTKYHYCKWLFQACTTKCKVGASHATFSGKLKRHEPKKHLIIHDQMLKEQFKVLTFDSLLVVLSSHHNANNDNGSFSLLPNDILIEVLSRVGVSKLYLNNVFLVCRNFRWDKQQHTKKRKFEEVDS